MLRSACSLLRPAARRWPTSPNTTRSSRATSSPTACPRARASPGTVARGELPLEGFLVTGKIDGADGDGFPFPVTAQVMNRGQERFNIYCSPCHGRRGDGNGMIPSRGYRHPPSFHTEALRTAKTGHFFDVMTNGFGAMPPYNVQVPVNDRWAIIAYIRALQLSQNGTVNDLPPAQRAQLRRRASDGATCAPARRVTGIARWQMPSLIAGIIGSRSASSATSSIRRRSSAPICRASSSGSRSWPARWPC